MIRQFITLAFRNILKNRTNTILNIISFSIGLAACIIALLFVNQSLSYDNFHKDTDRIYKVLKRTEGDAGINVYFGTNGIAGPEIKANYPQAEMVTRVMRDGVYVNAEEDKENGFNELIYIVDPEFLKMFHCPVLSGENETVLEKPFSVIISDDLAERMFGEENPIGKTLEINGYYIKKDYTITGVFKEFPDNSIFFASLITAEHDEMPEWLWESWNVESSYLPVFTFVKLEKGVDYKAFEKSLEKLVEVNYPEELQGKTKYLMQKFERMFLYSQQDFGQQFYSNIVYVYIFIALALFILIISSVNFINLTTGRLLLRAKEIGVKKAFGTGRYNIYLQFISESIFMIIITIPISLLIVYYLLPFFEQSLNIDLQFEWMLNFRFISRAIIMIIFIGTITGLLSAVSFTWVTPASVMQGKLNIGSSKHISQKVMFIIQYTLSVILISTTIVLYMQLKYMMNKDLGFDKENKIVIPIFATNRDLRLNYQVVKQEFLKHPDIISASASHFLIGSGGERHKVIPEGKFSEEWNMAVLAVDEDFIETYGLTLLQGRDFSGDIISDQTEAFILNEAAVKRLNWKDPIGKSFEWPYGKGNVIGVVKDFNAANISQDIEPLVLCMWVPLWNFLTVKYKTEDYNKLLTFLEEKCKMFDPDLPFNFFRFDEAIDRNNLQGIETFKNTTLFFTFIAVLIACIGLFGLANFSANQKIKEIGIRKANGATAIQIARLSMAGFLKWVIIACIIALPLSWLLADKMLQAYPYRIKANIWIFLFAGVIAVVIAIITVSTQTLRSATRNPVEALRYE
jgi:putative ABC transport system permease protein